MPNGQLVDMTGKVFGELRVIERAGKLLGRALALTEPPPSILVRGGDPVVIWLNGTATP